MRPLPENAFQLENLNPRDFSNGAFLADFDFPPTVQDYCNEITWANDPDPREDLIHPFTD